MINRPIEQKSLKPSPGSRNTTKFRIWIFLKIKKFEPALFFDYFSSSEFFALSGRYPDLGVRGDEILGKPKTLIKL
jgi:hypothetical protein